MDGVVIRENILTNFHLYYHYQIKFRSYVLIEIFGFLGYQEELMPYILLLLLELQDHSLILREYRM